MRAGDDIINGHAETLLEHNRTLAVITLPASLVAALGAFKTSLAVAAPPIAFSRFGERD